MSNPPDRPKKPRKPMPKLGTKAERKQAHRERVAYTARLLARRAYKHEVIALLRHRYSCSTRTAVRILASAREELARRAGKPREAHRNDAYSFYESIIRDPDATLHERMYAQDRINTLLGLNAPQEHRLGGSADAGPIRVREVVVRTREEAAEMMKRLATHTGQGDGGN